ncbi:MAG: NFACT family protein [Nitrososphaerota archaeon]|nr:NFACT family protein [Nitrososphaerota archaeon]MDG6973880.1 NFACT family protein [Nitrososphaerota archaeon]MDG6975141.1 NFACT family protein [Nitrososphaerota archaeon]MDG7009550.1 NFACT family protein [Nitrososphaerota archaeon]MDG7019310.1 NFACT family protein [Nitrososphaerota archaeon]
MAELSGIEVAVLVKELHERLLGCYVNNIYSAGESQIFRLRKPGGEETWLVASPKTGVWISSDVSQRAETSGFTSRLRSELERARFTGSSQLGLDRVFELDFQGRESRKVMIEMMPPGNIVVLDAEGKVALAQHDVRAKSRVVAKGVNYTPPKQGRISPLDVGPGEAREILAKEPTLGKAIGRHVALPRKYVAEALRRLGTEEGAPSASLAGREEEMAAVLSGMVSEARDSPKPCVCATSDGDEIYAFPPQGLSVKTQARTMSELCDSLLLREATEATPEPGPEESKRLELLATAAKLRRESDALLADAARARGAAVAARSATVEEAVRQVEGAGLKPAKPLSSPAAAASALYDRAKELEAKSANDLEAATKLEKRAARAGPVRKPDARRLSRARGEWYEKFRWFVTSGGKLAVGGRDAQTNAYLLGRHLEEKDTVFHADLFGSPFFILKGGAAQTEEEVKEVAQATVAFSSAWKTGLGSADAYWVGPDQVSSSAPSGEYLPRGSFAIKGKKNFVSKVLVEVALGMDGDGRVMGGPEGAVKLRCPHYVVLRPHNEKGSETAKKVLKKFEGPEVQRAVTIEEVQRALPAGGGKVLRSA